MKYLVNEIKQTSTQRSSKHELKNRNKRRNELVRMHDQIEDIFYHAEIIFQSTEGRGIENEYRICKICLMEQKKNVRIKYLCVRTYRCTH